MLPSAELKEGDDVVTDVGTGVVVSVTDLQVVVRLDDGRVGTFFKTNVESVARKR